MKITINDDFDLYKIAYSGQCFRVKQIDENTFRFITGGNTVTISQPSIDDASLRNNPIIQSELDVSCTKQEWDSIWHDYFDLDTNYSAIRMSIPESDKYLKTASEIGKGIRILRQNNFEMLISFIISQRKSIPAIKSSVESLSRLYGRPVPGTITTGDTYFEGHFAGTDSFESQILAFPTPQNLLGATAEELKKCGLGYRVPYIIKAVERVACGETNLDALCDFSDEELLNELKSFYGVGDKVANCIALFSYHRMGLAPVDTWIKKIIETEYDGHNPFPGYGKYAGLMQQYMFYAAQHMKIL